MLLIQALASISTRGLIVALDLGACCTNKCFKWPFTETQRSVKGKRKVRKNTGFSLDSEGLIEDKIWGTLNGQTGALSKAHI